MHNIDIAVETSLGTLPASYFSVRSNSTLENTIKVHKRLPNTLVKKIMLFTSFCNGNFVKFQNVIKSNHQISQYNKQR